MVGVVEMLGPRTRLERLPAVGITAMALLVLLAVGAFFGGWGLMNPSPDGSGLGMPVAWLQHSPFTSYFIPGLLLFGVFGVGSMVAVLAGLARHWTAPFLCFAIGVGQMIWITVELIMVQIFHPVLHPGCFGLGLVIAGLSCLWWRKRKNLP